MSLNRSQIEAVIASTFVTNTTGNITPPLVVTCLDDMVNNSVLPEDLIAGTNITLDKSALPAITINSSGGGGGVTSVTANGGLASSGGATPNIAPDGSHTIPTTTQLASFVTGVSGTGGLTSSGGTTPAIGPDGSHTIPTTSQLASFVTSVTANGGLASSGGTTPNIGVDGSHTIPTTAQIATFLTTANIGTTAGKIIELDGSARIPAVNGSLLTNLNAVPYTGATSDVVLGTHSISTDTGSVTTGLINGVAGTLQVGGGGDVVSTGNGSELDDGSGNIELGSSSAVTVGNTGGFRNDGSGNCNFYAVAIAQICSGGSSSDSGVGATISCQDISNGGNIQLYVGSACGAIGNIEMVGGLLFVPPFATGDGPASISMVGAMYFDTTLGKLVIGGAAGWEVVTSIPM